jgi:hypothetical protein
MGISSHLLDPVTEGLDEQLKSYLTYFDQRDDEILHHIAEGVDTVKQLAQIPVVYPKIPYPVYILFEEIMIDKHIEFLSENDRVHIEDGHIQVQKS